MKKKWSEYAKNIVLGTPEERAYKQKLREDASKAHKEAYAKAYVSAAKKEASKKATRDVQSKYKPSGSVRDELAGFGKTVNNIFAYGERPSYARKKAVRKRPRVVYVQSARKNVRYVQPQRRKKKARPRDDFGFDFGF